MRNPRSAKHQRGFSLIDTVAATALLAIGLVSTFAIIGTGSTMNTDGKITSQAYMAAQQEIEVLRNMPYQQTSSSPGIMNISRTTESRFIKPDGTSDASTYGDVGYPGLVPALANLPKASGSLVITPDPVYGNMCKNVTVIVRWTDSNKVSRFVAIPTSIAQGGVNPQ